MKTRKKRKAEEMKRAMRAVNENTAVGEKPIEKVMQKVIMS